MSESKLKPEELANSINYKPVRKNWMDPAVEIKRGVYNYSGIPKNVKYLQLPNPREWQPVTKSFYGYLRSLRGLFR